MTLHSLPRRRFDNSLIEEERKLIHFRIADVQCVIDIMHVREILLSDDTSLLPGAPPFVIGVATHRNEVIPVVDMRRRLGLPSEKHDRQKWIIVTTTDRSVILAVDAVAGVVSPAQQNRQSIEAFDATGAMSISRGSYITATGILFELDPELLYPSTQTAATPSAPISD